MLHLPIGRFEKRNWRPFGPSPAGGGGGGSPALGAGAGASAAGGGAAGGSGAGGASGGSGGGSGGGAGSIYNQAVWLLQPSSFINIDKWGYVALPAVGASAIILQFKVPSGRHAKIAGIGMDFVANGASSGGLFTQGVIPYQLAFSLTTDAVGTAFADFALFNYLPGSVSSPMPIAGLMVKEGQTITLSVKNISVGVATQFIGGHLQGYSYPKNLQGQNMGYQ